jgi:hypothetical protein
MTTLLPLQFFSHCRGSPLTIWRPEEIRQLFTLDHVIVNVVVVDLERERRIEGDC